MTQYEQLLSNRKYTKKGYAQKVTYDGVLHSADEMDRSITIACKRYAQISREDREIETHTHKQKHRERD